MEQEESRDLVDRASRGDALAIDQLLDRHLPGLRLYVRERLSPSLLAKESGSDIVQSVCREVLEALHGFEYQGEAAFRGWLNQAALRKLVDRQRHYDTQKRGAGQELVSLSATALSSNEASLLARSIGSPSGDAIMREEVERLERAFEQLSVSDRTIVRMVYIHGMTHAQVAEKLDMTETASRKALSRALAKLSRILA
jgi:RNA polymerase sigma-70 factor (subfamily 1)